MKYRVHLLKQIGETGRGSIQNNEIAVVTWNALIVN